MESNFKPIKGVKWQIPVFDKKTTSWRRFEKELVVAMRHLHLDSVLDGEKDEVPVANRTLSRDRLHAHYSKSKLAKYVVCGV